MWSKRREDEVPARQANVPPTPTSDFQRRESTSMATPTRSFDPEPVAGRAGSATLGKSVVVKGQIFSREDLTLDGEMEGTVECQEHRLTVGPNAKITASLKAREIIIQGTINGNVEATEKIDLRKEAKLVGDIKTARITIEDGAYFKGSIDISKAAAPVRPAQAAPAAQAPSGQPQNSGASGSLIAK